MAEAAKGATKENHELFTDVYAKEWDQFLNFAKENSNIKFKSIKRYLNRVLIYINELYCYIHIYHIGN